MSEEQPAGKERPPKRRKKSLFIAFLLWFFFGIIAAHKFYLGKIREAVILLLAYFFLPFVAVLGVVVVLKLLGFQIVPAAASPEDLRAFLRDPKFIALVVVALIVLAAVWIWDFTVLMRQVREYNEGLEAETTASIEKEESPPSSS